VAANNDLKVRCPSCGSKYKVPASAVGRKLRCAKCQSAFRVSDPRADSHRSPSPSSKPRNPAPAPARPAAPQSASRDLKSPPTDEDILRWLSEADDDADLERRSEMSHAPPTSRPVAAGEPSAPSPEAQPGLSSRLRIVSGQDDSDDVLKMRHVV
jgi:predicted Zn finger-like uncharacterized protein